MRRPVLKRDRTSSTGRQSPPTQRDGYFSIREENPRLRFEAVVRFEPQLPGPGWRVIHEAVALPVLGRRRDHRFVRTRFEWEFQGAAVESISLSLSIGGDCREIPGEINVARVGAPFIAVVA